MDVGTLSKRFGVGRQTIRRVIHTLGCKVRKEGVRLVIDNRDVERIKGYFTSDVRNSHLPKRYRRNLR